MNADRNLSRCTAVFLLFAASPLSALAAPGGWSLLAVPDAMKDGFLFDATSIPGLTTLLTGFETLPGEPIPGFEAEPFDFEAETYADMEKASAHKGEGEEEGDFNPLTEPPLYLHGTAWRRLGDDWNEFTLPEISHYWSLYAVDVAADGSTWLVGKDFDLEVVVVNEGGIAPEGDYDGEILGDFSGSNAIALTFGVDEAPTLRRGPDASLATAVAARNESEAYIADRAGIYFVSGDSWEPLPAPPLTAIFSLAPGGPGELLAAGALGAVGAIARWDGTAWMQETLPSMDGEWQVHALAAIPDEEVWAVGCAINLDDTYRGVVLRHDGTSWVEETLPAAGTNWYLVDVSAPEPGRAWAIGKDFATDCGLVLRRDGGGWIQESLPPSTGSCSLAAVSFSDTLTGVIAGYDEVEARPRLLQYAAAFHTADTDQSLALSLSELLRVVQLYNAEGLHCAADSGSTEDGFEPGADPGAQSCLPHDTDYLPQDWVVSLSELLRAIQFFNAKGYAPCGLGEDGFCP